MREPVRIGLKFAVNAVPSIVRTLPFVLIAIVFGTIAIKLGQSDTFDLRNYHLYDGWAFWTDRGARDYAAAQMQSYFNPLLSTFAYLLYVNTPPRVSAFVFGALQSLNVVPLYFLARALLPAALSAGRFVFALCTALAGVLGATQLAQLGTSFGDTLVSLPILAAFAVTFARPDLTASRAALAGLLLGVGVGIKLTCAPFALGLLAAVIALTWNMPQRWRIPATAIATTALGFLAVDGFWLLHLYREFGNPLHPMFGNLFGGEQAGSLGRDTRFLPRSPWEWPLYPLVWLFQPQRVSEQAFFDLRVPLAFMVLPVLLWRGSVDAGMRTPVRALAVALLIAYWIWLGLFSIYRYIAPLEMLAPLLVALALDTLKQQRYRLAMGGSLLAIVVLTQPPDTGRLPHFAHHFLRIDVPPTPGLDRATVVLAESQPLAFLALGFPPTTSFVHVASDPTQYPIYGRDGEAAHRLAAASGLLYALLVNPDVARTNLARHHLELVPPCAFVRSNLLPVRDEETPKLCPLSRTGD